MTSKESFKTLKHLSKHLLKSKYYFVSPSKFTHFKRVPTQSQTMKPRGLWFACGDAWLRYVMEENFKQDSYKFLYEVNINNPNILFIRSIKDYDEFEKKFSYVHKHKSYIPKIGSIQGKWIENSYVLIDWQQVQEKGYHGLIICPSLLNKLWKRNKGNTDNYLWYYTWDVASGVIWNEGAVKNIELLFSKSENKMWKKNEK
jgi:hypothetical protein